VTPARRNKKIVCWIERSAAMPAKKVQLFLTKKKLFRLQNQAFSVLLQ
jgi:hypothetical protein